MSDTIDVTREGDLWIVTLNRPDKANALTADMLHQLADIAAAAAGARAFILTGRGKVFSAGADLADVGQGLATDPVLQVAGSGGEHPDIHLSGLPRPHRANLPLLQDAQQFDLHGQGQFTDLIEKDGGAIGNLKQPFSVGLGSCEGPPDMAELLAFQQGFRDRAAVHRHHLGGAAGRAVVDAVGDHLFSGA